MVEARRLPRLIRSLLIAGICLLVLHAMPIRTAEAATIHQAIDNKVAEFSRGAFQRSSLALLQSPASSTKIVDQPGAVQLGPIGLLKEWFPGSVDLPKRLRSLGAAAIGNRIYVMGGVTSDTSPPQAVADVWSIAVNQDNGSFLTPQWDDEPDLPPVQSSDQFTDTVAAVSSAAVTAVDNSASGGGGYIYVIGGEVTFGQVSVSSYAVRMAAVGPDGRISGWKELPEARIPGQPSRDPENPAPDLPLGLQSASVVSLNIDDTTYIYLIGGLERFAEGIGGQTQITSRGTRSVFYARVGSGGELYKPGSGEKGWDVMKDAAGNPVTIPLPPETPEIGGLWDAVAVADTFPVAGAGLFISGGQITPNEGDVSASFSNVTYRAQIGRDGKISQFIADTPPLTLPESRWGHAGVTFRGNIYITGGIPDPVSTQEPDNAILTSYVKDDFSLPVFGDSGSNFLKSSGDGKGLSFPRAFHASVLVRAGPNSPNSAFVYVLGGRGGSGPPVGDEQGSNNVIYGKVGGSEDIKETGYAPDGWYYSTPYTIKFLQAEIREVSWATVITRTASPALDMDITLEYRTSLASSCSTPGWSDSDWQPLDGSPADAYSSVNGQNTATLSVQARCFQYRAKLTTNDFHFTPSLLNLGIQIFIPGGPDLHVATLEPRMSGDGAFTGLNITIENRNLNEPPTLPADVEEGGSFLVDLLVFGEGQPVKVPTVPLKGEDLQNSKAYINIPKAEMGADTTRAIRNNEWCPSSDPNCTAKLDNLLSLFPLAGTYTVIVAVDSGCPERDFGCVNEGLQGGEANNVTQATVVVPKKDPNCVSNCAPDVELPNDGVGGNVVNLPIVARQR